MFSLLSIAIRISHHAIDARPKTHVDHVGVWKRGSISAKRFGKALCAAIDSVVRAVGRIVVCVDAIADDRIASISSLFHGLPTSGVSESSGFFARNPGPL